MTGTFCCCIEGAFGFAGSLQSYGFAPLRQPQNFSPIPSVLKYHLFLYSSYQN